MYRVIYHEMARCSPILHYGDEKGDDKSEYENDRINIIDL